MGSPQQPRPFSEQLREGSESPETGLIISFIRAGVCFPYPNWFHSRGPEIWHWLTHRYPVGPKLIFLRGLWAAHVTDHPAMKQFLYYSCLGTSACHVTSKQRQKSLWVTRDQPALHLAREHVRYASITRSGPFLKTANSKNKHLKWDGLPVQRSQLLKANYR